LIGVEEQQPGIWRTNLATAKADIGHQTARAGDPQAPGTLLGWGGVACQLRRPRHRIQKKCRLPRGRPALLASAPGEEARSRLIGAGISVFGDHFLHEQIGGYGILDHIRAFSWQFAQGIGMAAALLARTPSSPTASAVGGRIRGQAAEREWSEAMGGINQGKWQSRLRLGAGGGSDRVERLASSCAMASLMGTHGCAVLQASAGHGGIGFEISGDASRSGFVMGDFRSWLVCWCIRRSDPGPLAAWGSPRLGAHGERELVAVSSALPDHAALHAGVSHHQLEGRWASWPRGERRHGSANTPAPASRRITGESAPVAPAGVERNTEGLVQSRWPATAGAHTWTCPLGG